jgi:hypothetical protein
LFGYKGFKERYALPAAAIATNDCTVQERRMPGVEAMGMSTAKAECKQKGGAMRV